MEALADIRIPGEAMQVLLVVLRKTYGFNKKEDAISLSQFNRATHLVKPSIIRALNVLSSMNIISKNANGSIRKYRFNKDYSSWKRLAKKLILAKTLTGISENAKRSVSENATHKRNKDTKETITKEIAPPEAFAMFWKYYPAREGKKIGKPEAEELFKKLSAEEQEDIQVAVRAYAGSTDYPVDPIRFFKSREYPKGLWRNFVPERPADYEQQKEALAKSYAKEAAWD